MRLARCRRKPLILMHHDQSMRRSLAPNNRIVSVSQVTSYAFSANLTRNGEYAVIAINKSTEKSARVTWSIQATPVITQTVTSYKRRSTRPKHRSVESTLKSLCDSRFSSNRNSDRNSLGSSCHSASPQDTNSVQLNASSGLIVKSPDGTKQYRIRAYNSGNLVTEQI